MVETKTGQTRRLTLSSTGGVPVESFVAPRLVTYPTQDNLVVPAFVYLPKNLAAGEKAPCIMYLHGGPEGQETPDFSYLFQYFLNRGYAIFAPNVRGSAGYGKQYLALDDVGKRMDSVRDMADAVAFIAKNLPQIDARRIALGDCTVLWTPANDPSPSTGSSSRNTADSDAGSGSRSNAGAGAECVSNMGLSNSTCIANFPMETMSPSESSTTSTCRPFTLVPLRDPRSLRM